jgi:hypothetical protein
MPTWQERMNRVFGPGVLGGITAGDWLALLRDNGFRVNPSCLPRALSITWQSMLNSPTRWAENRRYAREIEAVDVPAPLFVLGHFRSGTTLLHDLLAADERFACPNLFQVIYPHTFLTTEAVGSRLFRLFAPNRRPQDNMKLDPSSAWEDEFAMCVWGFRSPYLGWAFPRRVEFYDRYLTFADASPQELNEWRDSMKAYLRKLAFKHGGKPLVLKSPTHTARIRLLLEMFPGARFVHIHRNPFDVYRSTLHLHTTAMPMMRLQRTDGFDWEGRVIRQYTQMYDAFFKQRTLIPPGCYHEVSFESLEKDPMGEMAALYRALDLPDFAGAEPRLREYVQSIAQYQKNSYRELDADVRRKVGGAWKRCFEEWGYPV